MDFLEECDSENSFDSEEENYDSVYQMESDFLDKEKDQDEYYIGIYKNMNNELVYINALSKYTFFHFPYNFSLNYLYFYSIIDFTLLERFSTKIDIMKLDIAKDGTYNVIIKTFWIKIIQRTWKRVLKERLDIIKRRGFLGSQQYFSLHGKYPCGLKQLPSLYGMLV